MTGSQLDYGAGGGRLDGALGVLAGLECLRTLRAARVRAAGGARAHRLHRRGGRFYGFFGSRAMTGSLDAGLAARLLDPTGLLLPDAVRRASTSRGRPMPAVSPGRSRLRRAAHRAGTVARGRECAHRGRRADRRHPAPPAHLSWASPITRGRPRWTGGGTPSSPQPSMRRRAGSWWSGRGAARSVTTIGVVDVRPGLPNIVPARIALLPEIRDPDPARHPRLAVTPDAPGGPSGGAAPGSERREMRADPV